ARQICLRNPMRAVEHVASAGHDDWIAQVRVKDITRMLSNPADGRLHIVRPAKPNHLVKNIQLFDRNGGYRLSVGHRPNGRHSPERRRAIRPSRAIEYSFLGLLHSITGRCKRRFACGWREANAVAHRIRSGLCAPSRWRADVFNCQTAAPSSFRDAQGAGPESITMIVNMDSGLAPRGAPRNDEGRVRDTLPHSRGTERPGDASFASLER